jgi:hypothetical protein
VSEIDGPPESSTTGAGSGAADKGTETATDARTESAGLEPGQRGPAAPAATGDASQPGLKAGAAGEVNGQQAAVSESAAANRGPETGASAVEAGQRGPADNADAGAVTAFPDKDTARQAFEGDSQAAANRFFRGATSKSTDYQVQDLGNGQHQMQFYSPADNPGYGKLYVQQIDSSGGVLCEYKDTVGPDGLVERKWLSGGP